MFAMKLKITLFRTGKVDATKAYVRGTKLWLLNTFVANKGIKTTLIESTKSYFIRALNIFCLSPRKYITMIVYTVNIVYYRLFTNKNVNNSVKPINDLMEFESKLILLFCHHLCSLCLNVALPVLSRPGGIALLSTGYLLNAIK